jgi:DNA-binding NarL/FixJ family response regulator
MSESVQKIAAVIDAIDFRRAMAEKFLAAWARYENVDLVSIAPEQARERLGKDMNCSMLIYFAARALCFSPGVLGEIRDLRDLQPTAALVIVADNGCLDDVSTVVNAGAQGYLDIAMQPAAALQALSFVLRGGIYITPTAVLGEHPSVAYPHNGGVVNGQHPACAVERSDPRQIDQAAIDPIRKEDVAAKTVQLQLTEREQAIISCLYVGDSNKAIAHKLGMTEPAVKVHLRQVMRKLGVSNRTQVAIVAARNGLVSHNGADQLHQDVADAAISTGPHH